jgi:hypothetical protein
MNDICHVICLEDAHGESAGLLRRMDDDVVTPGAEIELIAISAGSVNHKDLEYAYEDSVNRTQVTTYPSRSVSFWRFLPGKNDQPTLEERIGRLPSFSFPIAPANPMQKVLLRDMKQLQLKLSLKEHIISTMCSGSNAKTA